MTFATFTNMLVILLCGAVLVQSVRTIRSFRAVKDGALKDMVESLEKATAQARAVLADLKETLRTDAAANARVVEQGEAMRDELSVLVGIANAVAERIVDSVEANRPSRAAKATRPRPTAVKAVAADAVPLKAAPAGLPVKQARQAPKRTGDTPKNKRADQLARAR